MQTKFRADLFVGTAYGLGLSALLWTIALSPPPWTAACILVWVLCASAGVARPRVGRFGRVDIAYPGIVASLLLFGAGASLIAGLMTTIGATISARGRTRRTLRTGTWTTTAVVLASSAAALTFFAAGGSSGPLRIFSPAALVAHGLTFVLCRSALTRAFLFVTVRTGPRVDLGRTFGRSIVGVLGGIAVAAGFAWAFEGSDQRPLLVSACFFLLMLAMSASRRDLERLTRRHVESAGSLYRAVAEALSRAMEAKDEGTQLHLRRVRRLCLAVGRRAKLSEAELEALSVASLLHDIGKLAVPERILTKPGRLTDEEMEQVRVHPGVGADILETIPFPYPLAEIVRHHHERWDGRGYPDGLLESEIPLGSRILTVVDTFDALTSDRPYRRALPQEEAMAFLQRESGRMFDPTIVEVLVEYLEGIDARVDPAEQAPAEPSLQDATTGPANLPSAQLELNTLYDISRAVDQGLDMEEALMLVACRLSVIVPYESLVVYFLENDSGLLRAGFAMGKAADKLKLTAIPVGERLSGWAALQQRALIGKDHLTPLERDGSRSDLEDWDDDDEMRSLASTVAAPIVANGRKLGVLTLYGHEDRQFTPDDRRILVHVAGEIARIADRLGSVIAEADASLTDPLTGVPNARFLWLETAHRVALSREICPGFGLLAFRVGGLEQIGESLGNAAADRVLCRIARLFAGSCAPSETLVRFGYDVFIVLTPTHRSGALVERWHDLAAEIERPGLTADDGTAHPLRMTAAHASFPEDGAHLKSLLNAMDERLGQARDRGANIIPFRPRRTG